MTIILPLYIQPRYHFFSCFFYSLLLLFCTMGVLPDVYWLPTQFLSFLYKLFLFLFVHMCVCGRMHACLSVYVYEYVQ